MDTALKIGKFAVCVCGCILLLAMTVLVLDSRTAVTAGRDGIKQVAADAHKTFDGINRPCPTVVSVDPDCGVIAQAAVTLKAVNASASGLTVATGSLNKTILTANETLRLVNRPCGTVDGVFAPCGTLADFNRTLATARGTMGQIEIAANHEDKNLETLDAQEAMLVADTHKTLTDADALISSPYIVKSLQNLDSSTASLADSMKQGDAILTDGREFADKYAHPSKKKLTFWTATEAFGDWVRHFMPPLL